ncbi:MAG TPA: T9SS type A sorting domain-containing protein [Bacteroidales bacterium]|nr:T9SS type A sorting domain-containing protein [Bacteroidales bacterium]
MKNLTGVLPGLIIWALFSVASFGQHSQSEIPLGISLDLPLETVPVLQKGLTETQEIERDQRAGVHKPGTAMLAGFAVDVNIFPQQFSEIKLINEHITVMRMVVTSTGAIGMGLVFDGFRLRENERLFVYSPCLTTVHGPFDKSHNVPSGILTTPVAPGDSLIIEFHSPNGVSQQTAPSTGHLRLKSIIHIVFGGGIEHQNVLKGLGDAGTCNVNINCPEGQNWRSQQRGVARILLLAGGRWFYCSGTLINNTRNDGAMLFLTANHCGENATVAEMQQWQFYFNFEMPGCVNVGTPPSHVLTGAEVLASALLSNGSDFKLLRITQSAPRAYNLFWNGWDRREDPVHSGVSIHHPAGDAKKISTFWETTVAVTPPPIGGQVMAPNSAWRVLWAPTISGHGIVEGGSSGSPLFSSYGFVIGTLAGGASTCTQRTLPDFYGRFSYHWNKNGTHHTVSLAPHLDPLGLGVETLAGFDPNTVNYEEFQEDISPSLAKVYPNPSTGLIYLSFSKNLPFADIYLLNVNGRVILSQRVSDIQSGTRTRLGVHDLESGTYFLRIKSSTETEVLRIVVID